MCLSFRNKFLETQDAWAPEGCLGSWGLPSLRPWRPGRKSWVLEQTWPWLHTALFRRKIKFSGIHCRLPLAVFTKAPFCIVHCHSPTLANHCPSPVDVSGNSDTLVWLKRQREEDWLVFNWEVVCVELNFWLFISHVFVLTKRQHIKLHPKYWAENVISTS